MATARRWNPEAYQRAAKVQQGITFGVILRNWQIFASAKSPASLLDVGCGPGNFTKLFTNFTNIKRIVGIDMLPEMIAKARESHESSTQFQFEVIDICEVGMGYSANLCNSFELGFSSLVFHYIKPELLEHTLKTLRRCFKVGAVFVLSMPDFWMPSKFHKETDFEEMKHKIHNGKWGEYIEEKSLEYFDRSLAFQDYDPGFYTSTAEKCGFSVKSAERYFHVAHLTHSELIDYINVTVSGMVEKIGPDQINNFYADWAAILGGKAEEPDQVMKLSCAMFDLVLVAK